jgi:hypothetical protein
MNFSTQAVVRLLELCRAGTALINEKGDILAENQGWRDFRLRNGFHEAASGEQRHTLKKSAFVIEGADAFNVNQGVQRVLIGAEEAFSYTYEYPSPQGPRWFCVTATRFNPSDETKWVVLTHTEVAEERPGTINLVVVCGWCERISEADEWMRFEEYFMKQQGMKFSHGICPECRDRVLREAESAVVI